MNKSKIAVLLNQWVLASHLVQILFLDNWWMLFAIPFSCAGIAIAEVGLKSREDLWERDKEDIIDRLIYEEQMEEEEKC